MSEHAAALQNYNQELVKCFERIRQQRKEVAEWIERQEEEKASLEKIINEFHLKLDKISSSLDEQIQLRDTLDEIIANTEVGYKKILETSQTLLTSLQLETTRVERMQAKSIIKFDTNSS